MVARYRAASRWVLPLLALALFAGSDAQAQPYPNKTIKLVVPFGPGGPTDVSARIVSQVLQTGLGQNVVIENRPGAGGATGTKSVATGDADGYTILIGTSATLGVVPALQKNPGYDPIKSFAPVAKVSDSTTVLIVHPSFPANSIAELVAGAKANPGKLSYASAGAGNQTQLAAELLKARAGIEAVPRGQMEAARSLGMSYTRAMATIIIPQAFRIIVPPLTNEFVLLIKDTSLISVLGVTASTLDLARFGRNGVNDTANATPLVVAGLVYLALTIPLTQLAAWMERRSKAGRR